MAEQDRWRYNFASAEYGTHNKRHTSEKTNTMQSKTKGRKIISQPCFSEMKKEDNSTSGRSFDARNKTVNIGPLKSFVLQKFPKDCPLRLALLAERDILTFSEFVAKMETWTNLLKMI